MKLSRKDITRVLARRLIEKQKKIIEQLQEDRSKVPSENSICCSLITAKCDAFKKSKAFHSAINPDPKKVELYTQIRGGMLRVTIHNPSINLAKDFPIPARVAAKLKEREAALRDIDNKINKAQQKLGMFNRAYNDYENNVLSSVISEMLLQNSPELMQLVKAVEEKIGSAIEAGQEPQ